MVMASDVELAQVSWAVAVATAVKVAPASEEEDSGKVAMAMGLVAAGMAWQKVAVRRRAP